MCCLKTCFYKFCDRDTRIQFKCSLFHVQLYWNDEVHMRIEAPRQSLSPVSPLECFFIEFVLRNEVIACPATRSSSETDGARMVACSEHKACCNPNLVGHLHSFISSQVDLVGLLRSSVVCGTLIAISSYLFLTTPQEQFNSLICSANTQNYPREMESEDFDLAKMS